MQLELNVKEIELTDFGTVFYQVSTRTGDVTNSPRIFFAIQDDAIPLEVRERFEIVKGSYPGFFFNAENATDIDKRCSRNILPIRGLENLDQLTFLRPHTFLDQRIFNRYDVSGIDRMLLHYAMKDVEQRRKELGEEARLEISLPSEKIQIETVKGPTGLYPGRRLPCQRVH